MTQFTFAGSAGLGTTLPSLSRCRLGCPATRNAAFHLPASKPSTVVEPSVKLTLSPELGTFLVLNDTPSLVTRSCARSQFEKWVNAVTKTCSWQVEPSA